MKEKIAIKNEYYQKIVMCCASCKHNAGGVGDSMSRRICSCGEGKVLMTSLCDKWEMKENLANAGKGGGRVKKKHYLDYVYDCRSPGNPKELTPLSVIRSEYIERYGDIYINKK